MIKIKSKSQGAELTSIIVDGEERLHDGKIDWNRHAPVLFPIVGQIKNGKTVIEGKEYYMFTSTDAITILDRRSENSVYSLPAVYIHDNTLTCVASASGTPYGYGVRYIDLNLDPNKSENAFDAHLIEIGDQKTSAEDTNGNTYTYYSGTLLAPGGVDIYYLHEVAG